MPITTTCPGCKALFRLPEELAGKQVRCQKCAQMFTVPMALNGLSAPAVATPVEAPQDEVILATLAPETPPPDEVVMATLAEPQVDAELPLSKKPAPPVRLVSLGWTLALLALFLFAMIATGTFASIWVATHLAPPLRMTAAPPLNVKQKDEHVFIDKGRDQGGDFKEKLNPFRMIAALDVEGQYEDARAITFNDSRDPDGALFKTYLVHLEADQDYIFDMKSNAFTTRMDLFDPNNNRIRTANAGNHSQIIHKVARAGLHRVHAVAVLGERGPYTLTISWQAKNADDK